MNQTSPLSYVPIHPSSFILHPFLRGSRYDVERADLNRGVADLARRQFDDERILDEGVRFVVRITLKNNCVMSGL